MNLNNLITTRIQGSLAAIESLRECTEQIAMIVNAVVNCLKQGGTIYTCGNGGSAAEALHLAEELIGRYRGNRIPLRAICLNSDPTAITCIANDFGFDAIFSRQCEALLTENDVLVAFSTSGNSANIVNAMKVAQDKNAKAIGLLGKDGGKCKSLCDLSVIIPSDDSAHIQEAHQVVMHIICEAAEQEFA